MKQTCLCGYLGVTCNHPDTFLHLPAEIRERIYQYAGVRTGTYISYPIEGFIPVDKDDYSPALEDYFTALSLARVCRQLRREVEGILFAQNGLVYYEDAIDDGLDFLGRLTPYQCSLLRDLHVHLYTCDDLYAPPMQQPRLVAERIDPWTRAVTNVLRNTPPQQLRLHIICDTGLSSYTAKVLEPLRHFPGAVLELELRLGDSNRDNRQLATLARDTAVHVQGRDLAANPDPFRFFGLPVEIRRHILTYTDLVTPHRKVEWDSERGFRASFIFCECDGSVCQEEDLHQGRSFIPCFSDEPTTGNYCKRYHRSHSARCNHGFGALSLLLTSRAMYEEALSVFYELNRVVILPDWKVGFTLFASPETGPQSDAATNRPSVAAEQFPDRDNEEPSWAHYVEHDATKLFLERIGPRGQRQLRNLEIVFPRIAAKSGLSESDPAYAQWLTAVECLAGLAARGDAAELTLTVHIWTNNKLFSRSPLSATAPLLDAQAPRFLKPLRALPQLKRLFVHLEWPRNWSPQKLLNDIKKCKIPMKRSPGCGVGLHYIPDLEEDIVKKEISLEKMVMGAHYDSYLVGKRDELPSQWLRGEWQ